MSRLLAIDVGTTSLRAAVVDEHLDIVAIEQRPNPPSSPADGLVEFDPAETASLVLDACNAVIARAGVTIDAVGVTTQRASTVLWDRSTGDPVGPGLGWQDLRTVGECIGAKAEHGWSIAPNQSVTKLSWLLQQTSLDPRRLCFGTIDSWVAWTLSEGSLHISDQTNASGTTTAMRSIDGARWRDDVCEAFGIPVEVLPEVVDSAGALGTATALPGSPPLCALIGDQQASLIGQACVRPGRAKITFGTGAMLDLCTGADAPASAERNPGGTYPLPLWSHRGAFSWGVEGIMLSAGSNVDWLRDDLGLVATSAETDEVAASCPDAAGVVYVPALLGLGTPSWDYGARGTLLGLTRGADRAHVVRAVLEGVAHRGADLVEAALADTRDLVEVDTIRIDGGMAANRTFVQALADAAGRPVEVAPVSDSTTIGAAFMAGVGIGEWGEVEDVDSLWRPARSVDPDPASDRDAARRTWHEAVARAKEWIPDLSALDF